MWLHARNHTPMKIQHTKLQQAHSKVDIVAKALHLFRVTASFWCIPRSSAVEEIKGQTLLPWELPSQCGRVIIIGKPGLSQGATFGVNEQRKESDRGRTTSPHLSGLIWGRIHSPSWRELSRGNFPQYTSSSLSQEKWILPGGNYSN